MKTLWTIIFVLALAVSVSAAPTLICSPQAGVTSYRLTGPSWVPTSVPAQSNGSINMDVSSAAVGTTSLTVRACKTDAVWGEQCSVPVPFDFNRPAPPAAASGITLAQ